MTNMSDSVFVIPGTFDAGQLGNLEKLSVKLEAKISERPFKLLDCHDQSLRTSGRLLIETSGLLHLVQRDVGVISQKAKGNGKFAQELSEGPVRSALAKFAKFRALTVLGDGRVETSSLSVLDELQKTQVRGTVMALTSAQGAATIVWLHHLRGYDRAYSKTCAAMSELGHADGGIEPLFKALFPDLERYQAKPHIPLGHEERAIEAAGDIIRTFLHVARQNEEGVIADIDTEFLHDYRVSLRRVRSVLSLFKGVFSEEQTAELKRTFSDLMTPTGRLRDLDVYLLDKEIYFSMLPPSLHVGVQKMMDQFERERTQELSRLSRRFRSKSYVETMDVLAEQFQGLSNLQAGPNADRGAYEYACALIWKRYRKVCKLARSITADTPDEAVHELRIDCKKLRYLMEFFAPLFDARAFKTIIKPLKKLQDNLGLFNDYSVQQEALLEFADQRSNATARIDAELGMAVGGLIAVLDQRQKAERDRVISNFEHFDGPQIRDLFRSLFHAQGD